MTGKQPASRIQVRGTLVRFHELKCLTKYFDAVRVGLKTDEFRQDDRDYRVGDYLLLRQFDPDTQQFSGGSLWCKVTFIVDDPAFVREGIVAMSVTVSHPVFDANMSIPRSRRLS